MDFDINDIAYDHQEERTVREKKAVLRIKVKVAVLEVWRKEGVPEGYKCPYNQSMFEKWEDDGLDVKIVLDGEELTVKKVFNVTAVTLNKHEGMKARAKVLMHAIKNRPTPTEEIDKLKAECAEQKAVIQELTNRTAELRYEIAELKVDLKAKDTTIETLARRVNIAEDKLKENNIVQLVVRKKEEV